jgi:hypothetical protein
MSWLFIMSKSVKRVGHISFGCNLWQPQTMVKKIFLVENSVFLLVHSFYSFKKMCVCVFVIYDIIICEKGVAIYHLAVIYGNQKL